jgi:hypothetical protein
MNMFRYLNYGLAAVLVFIGVKMLLGYILPLFGHHGEGESGHLMPNWASLLVIVTLLGTSIIASLIAARREARAERLSGRSPKDSPVRSPAGETAAEVRRPDHSATPVADSPAAHDKLS